MIVQFQFVEQIITNLLIRLLLLLSWLAPEEDRKPTAPCDHSMYKFKCNEIRTIICVAVYVKH